MYGTTESVSVFGKQRIHGSHIQSRRRMSVIVNQQSDGYYSYGKGMRVRVSAADMDRVQSFTWKDMLIWGGIPVVVMVILRLLVFGVYEIPSGSMLDTLRIGDHVVTTRMVPGVAGGVKRGDIIVFKDPAQWLQSNVTESSRTLFGNNNEYLIKRVIGLPGDVVACKGSGSPITVNGVPIDDSSIRKPGVNPSDIAFSITVTDGNLFVMGDNRSNSADSRLHTNDGNNGLVPIHDVQGVALAVYWPVTHWSSLTGASSIFSAVGGVTEAR